MDFIAIFKDKGYENNRWLTRYIKFVETFNTPQLIESHRHHILPQSLFQKYTDFNKYPKNKAVLSYRAHLIAHYMLAKAIGGNMWYAYNMMNMYGEQLDSVLYEKAQIELSKIKSLTMKQWYSKNKHPKGMKNKKHSIETKQKIGEWSKNRKQSSKTKQKLSDTWQNKTENEKNEIIEKIRKTKLGTQHSEDTKRLISEKARKRYDDGFKIIKTEEQNKKLSNTLKKYYKNNNHHTKGKTYEEIMGKEKAEKLKKIKSKNKHSKETKEKISKAHKGKIVSKETRQKLSELIPITDGNKNRRISPKLLDEFLENGWKKGYTRKKEKLFKCTYCGKKMNKGMLSRWHNEKCKFKPNMV